MLDWEIVRALRVYNIMAVGRLRFFYYQTLVYKINFLSCSESNNDHFFVVCPIFRLRFFHVWLVLGPLLGDVF